MHEIIKHPLPPPCTPHSIYATPPELVKQAVKSCVKAGIPWSIHLAEFDESDRFCDFLEIFAEEPELVKNGFVVHGNFLTESDLDFMAKKNIALVHCPQSHEWFGHKDPDFEMWKKSGVDICIATDSLASASSLDLTEQVKTLFRRYPKAFTHEEALAAITSTPEKYLAKTTRCGANTNSMFQ
jgi:cytosine/adenosine deaminase-related metal-dependent hydrolase